jgi:hypothetical protein
MPECEATDQCSSARDKPMPRAAMDRCLRPVASSDASVPSRMIRRRAVLERQHLRRRAGTAAWEWPETRVTTLLNIMSLIGSNVLTFDHVANSSTAPRPTSTTAVAGLCLISYLGLAGATKAARELDGASTVSPVPRRSSDQITAAGWTSRHIGTDERTRLTVSAAASVRRRRRPRGARR